MRKMKWFMAATAAGLLAMGGAAQAADSNGASMEMGWFGGPVYTGAPALTVTAALVRAGGGAADFKFSTALVSMLGMETVNAEVAKLTEQYGEEAVQDFLKGMTFAVNNSLKIATAQGVKLPAAPADLQGVKLAKALVKAGLGSDGTWWSGMMFDRAVSHPIHLAVMANIESNLSRDYDKRVHRILNQAMYDVSQALGMTHVKLASLH